jgi:glycosyltransferase involved in cell wall biosynthesis
MVARRLPVSSAATPIRPLRIAQVAPPMERVPPNAYGGTERIVHALVVELARRGHDVTTFASGDSDVPGTLVPVVPTALRPAGFGGDPWPHFCAEMLEVLAREDEFDLIHIHLEWANVLLARAAKTPVIGTFHGRIDAPIGVEVMRHATGGMVAISRAQARTYPEMRWEGIVHNGLDLTAAPFEPQRNDDLVFVGRVAPEKGIVEAMEIARLAGRQLRIAAKVGTKPDERAYHENVFLPALAKSDADYLGEVSTEDRDKLIAGAYAIVMPGSWPEPFGLVAIEALACGTPVLTRRVGALPEIIREGVDGFFGDDAAQLAFLVDRVAGLDREEIRRSVLDRFSAARMADGYERIYADRLRAAGRGELVPMEMRDGTPGVTISRESNGRAGRPNGSGELGSVAVETGSKRPTGVRSGAPGPDERASRRSA